MQFPAAAATLHFDSPLGPLWAAATDQGLCGLWFDGQRHLPSASATAAWQADARHPVLSATRTALHNYFAGDMAAFTLPLDLRGGTPFQQAVWQALLHIPSGASTSYGALSHRLGRPSAVRAVAGAVGRNPVSIVVPCHRVLGSDGSLTGYAGGLERKTALLQLEAVRQERLL